MTDEKEETGKGESPGSRHDKFIRDFLSEKETAKSFFREYLPVKVTKNLDFDTLRISKDKFVDKNLMDYFSDLLYSINLNNSPAFIYLLIEHKSWADRFVGFQLLKYMVRIWELHLKQNKKVRTLPVFLPIVIYHGSTNWRIEKNFISLFIAPDYVKEFIPDFEYNLQDISHLPDEEIKGEVFVRVILKTLKYTFNPDLKQKLPEILQLFKELKDKNKGT